MRFPHLPGNDPLKPLQGALKNALVWARDNYVVDFDGKAHVYTTRAHGRVPSVTQILNGYGKEGPARFVPPEALARGTAVHAAAEDDVAPDVDWAALLDGDESNPLYDGHRMGWKLFRSCLRLTPLVTEALLYHPTLRYCGQADYVCGLPSWAAGARLEVIPLVVVDLKSGSHKMAKRVVRQVGGYVEALRAMLSWNPLIMGCGVGLAADGKWDPAKKGDFRTMTHEDRQDFLRAVELYKCEEAV